MGARTSGRGSPYPKGRPRRRGAASAIAVVPILVAILLAAPAAGAPTIGPAADRGIDRSFGIDVVSSPAAMVTGGDALVRIDVPRNVPPQQVRVTLEGSDVTDTFAPIGDGRTLLGLVSGLALGDNELVVTARGRGHGRPDATAVLTNHPSEGPLFSGAHIPLYCTADGPPWNLGAVDEHCHVEDARITYRYRTTGGAWADLPNGDLPDDIAEATTTDGNTVPYVVRLEQGTINRAVYEFAILHEPGTPVPDPWTATPGWNGRLVYTFGGACGIGHTQATSTGGVLNDLMLSQGYAVASATFNVFANNCNDVTSAETVSMVKEHVIETYGVPESTMGWGASAGTMQQLLIANAYPGILDGVIGHIGYPDERSTTLTGHECRFLTGAISGSMADGLDWTEDEGRAVVGFARYSHGGAFGTSTCTGYMFFDNVDWPQTCPAHIPIADRYHPTDNPDGIRCAIADFVANVYGTDPDTGFGRPIIPDTVGVQYGLHALETDAISPEQFVDLNERVGGLDVEGNRTEERSRVDQDVLEVAYATGRINQFDGGLTWTPIIETRGYSDLRADFHDRNRTWSMRERLLAANGHAGNHVSWVSPEGSQSSALQAEALSAMDTWLTARNALAASHPELEDEALTLESRPADLADGCITPGGERIDEPLTLDPDAQCNQLFPLHTNPRIAAGGPTSNLVLSCALSDLDRDSYGVVFTDEQWERLEAVFPDGVCDWSQPGRGQVPLTDTWIRF